MTNAQLLLKNAHYYANGTFLKGDIVVRDGKIAAIHDGSDCGCQGPAAMRTIDAQNLLVLPGIIDSHVHVREPGRVDREDFFTGSRAAAAGGVTTFCEMPLADPPPNSVENLQRRIRLAEEKSLVDIAFYGAAGYANRFDLQTLVDAGVIGFKSFLHPAPAGREGEFAGLTVDDPGKLYMMLAAGAQTTGRYGFHCENAQLIAALEAELHQKGEEDYDFHYKSRPDVAEVESVATVLRFAEATGAKIEIVHITVPEACQLVKEAKLRGLDVIAETCFHYLVYDDSAIDQFGPYAKCNPPLRSRADVEGLWQYIADGTISIVGSDHAPFIPEEKAVGVREGIWRAYSGMPGVELLLPMMLNQVAAGRLTIEKMVQLISENTAKNFGLYPRKGCIAPGSDADFTIIDLNQSYTIRVADMKCKNPEINKMFDGVQVQGKPLYTIVRGRVIMENGLVDEGARGYGRFVASNNRKK